MLYFWIGLGICSGLALIALFVWCNNSWLKTTRYRVEAEGLENDVRIVHLSDLHGKSFGKANKRLLSRVEREKPDFIAFTGDIIHKHTPKNKSVAVAVIKELSKIAPVIFVSGNHEMRSMHYAEFKAELLSAGAHVLDNCTEDICGLTVAGLNCASQKNDAYLKVADEIKEGKFSVLLAHKPQFAENYAGAGFDLILCGHAHGGQWRIPFTKIGIYAPGQGMFPKLTSGVHVFGKTNTVISRGLGNSECPLRLFNRPEVVIVDLIKK